MELALFVGRFELCLFRAGGRAYAIVRSISWASGAKARSSSARTGGGWTGTAPRGLSSAWPTAPGLRSQISREPAPDGYIRHGPPHDLGVFQQQTDAQGLPAQRGAGLSVVLGGGHGGCHPLQAGARKAPSSS